MSERAIHCARALLAQGWRENVVLHLDGRGRIASITGGGPGDATAVTDGIVVPGMPNLHSHGFQRLMAGLTGGVRPGAGSFQGWRRAMYRLAARITPEQLEACLAWVYVEMLRSGYTSCAEFHYLHHQPGGRPFANPAEMSSRVLAAADAAGMALTLLPVLYCNGGFGLQPLNEAQERFHNTADGYLELLAACRALVEGKPCHHLGVAPHSLRAVPPGVLAAVLSETGRGMPTHIHVAEQPSEVRDCVQHLGARPVEWLLENCPVDDSWCLVHATHMEPGERRRAAVSGAVAGLCPTTEADLGDGCFDTAAWLSAGGRFGIGSDSNIRICVTEELRMLEFSERLRAGRRNVLGDGVCSSGRFLYEHATRSGARALGQPVGVLAPGFRADLVVLCPDHPLMAGRCGDAILDTWVFAGDESMVRSVFVAGRQLVEQGCHASEARFRDGYCRAAAELARS